ncbi:hypothetical protein QJ857_gp0709 [Tupanvirus soda lake]|uniref:ZZ-type domain-containing protein n=2 Tax=Tupanvirus TaxID=2094720 RepID=A0A6N1NV72_9VIRU|nr:hypothetical protein QJ857_gp0709 [Tupanvirus soda lake]QKU35338.1 hypothetical protein [Tupanvirus soda lake]
MSSLDFFWKNRKEEIIDFYLCTVFYNVLFDNSYDNDGRFLIDNSRHIKPIRLFRLKNNNQDIIVIDFTQNNGKSFWGSKLCDYNDIDQKIFNSVIESSDEQYDYLCDRCKETIINGYHCMKCNFDLCIKCHDNNIEHNHELIYVDKYLDLICYDYENFVEKYVVTDVNF